MGSRKRANGTLHGMIAVYKPKGMVSKDVSRWFERRLGKIKIGHVGTLDPMAEGVLPILFGHATRLQDFLIEHQKTYEFDVTFGQATTTLDADGEVIDVQAVPELTLTQLNDLCLKLKGDFLQVPPIFSAIKFQGKPLYEYARAGKGAEVPVEDLSKIVQLYDVEALSYQEPLGSFRVTCSKGTYIRVLAAKISESANTCGMVSRLLRSEAAGISLRDCWSLEDLEALEGDLTPALVPISKIDLKMPKWRIFDLDLVKRLRMGQRMQVDMRYFEDGLRQEDSIRVKISSFDRMLLLDPEGNSFGIGSASVQNTGRIAVVMRRGL